MSQKNENEYLEEGTQIHGSFLTYSSLEEMTDSYESQKNPNQILYSVYRETLNTLKYNTSKLNTINII